MQKKTEDLNSCFYKKILTDFFSYSQRRVFFSLFVLIFTIKKSGLVSVSLYRHRNRTANSCFLFTCAFVCVNSGFHSVPVYCAAFLFLSFRSLVCCITHCMKNVFRYWSKYVLWMELATSSFSWERSVSCRL